MLNTPFSPWPAYSQEEADAVRDVVLSNRVNYWTGNKCRLFEREFAAFSGVDHAISVANGTLALELALKALKVGPGDEVIVTPRTFLASVSCVVAVGATPVFADVDRDTQALSAETIEPKLSAATKAVIVVHLGGMPADMDPILELTKKHQVHVIEDCAQAHGAQYKGQPVGSMGDIGCWSFCQDKIMTTAGEGGMVTTNNECLWRRMWAFKDHGKSYEAVYERDHPEGFRWLHESFGSNYRMTEMQAVVGLIQLERMAQWTRQRAANASAIANACDPFSVVRTPTVGYDMLHAYYKHYCFVESAQLAEGWSRDRIASEINARGVPCFQGSCSEVYLEKAFDGTGWRPEQALLTARELGETSLTFLVHPTLTDTEVEKTCAVVTEVLSQAQA